MRVEALFLRRCEQIAKFVESEDEIDLLDLAGILRQMLLDKHCLIAAVNKSRLKIRYRVSGLEDADPPRIGALTMYRPLFTEGSEHRLLRDDEFLKVTASHIEDQAISVKDLIRCASHALGGIHHDPDPDPVYGPALDFWAVINLRGLAGGAHAIRDIGKIVLEGLGALITEVSARNFEPPAESIQSQGTIIAVIMVRRQGWVDDDQIDQFTLPSTSHFRGVVQKHPGRRLIVSVTINDKEFVFNLMLDEAYRQKEGFYISVSWDVSSDVAVRIGERNAGRQPYSRTYSGIRFRVQL